MQQWFQCPRCGSPNYVGQPFCRNCGQGFSAQSQQQPPVNQQVYSCPTCKQPVQYGASFCNYCRTSLNWPTQQQYPWNDYESAGQAAKESRKNPWLVGSLGIVLFVMFLGFIALATGIFPQGIQQSTPTLQLPDKTNPSAQQDSFDIIVKVNGNGTINPNGGNYKNGTSVVMIASGNPGWKFDHWGGDAVGNDSSITITMTSNKNIVAYFTKVQNILTVSINPIGAGKVVAGKSDFTGGIYQPGTTISFTAASNTDYVFDHWSGDASGTSRIMNVTMDSDKNIVANFRFDHLAYLNKRTRLVVTLRNIQNMADLIKEPTDPRVGIAIINNSEIQYAQTAFQAQNITMIPITMPEGELPAALEKGIVRAFLVSSEHPSPVVQDAISSNKINLLSFSGSAIQAVISKFPQAVATTLPPNTYTGQPQAISGYSLPGVNP